MPGNRRYVVARQAADALAAKIAFTDVLIDRLVCRLYGLTDDEIAVVEGGTQLLCLPFSISVVTLPERRESPFRLTLA